MRGARLWALARVAGGVAILTLVIWRVGTGPILGGLRMVSVSSLAAAAGIALVTTVAAAWRWTLVARGLGVSLSLPAATTAYYRSQFLNTTLPGGILGDVHRGLAHGRDAGDVSRGLRAVMWERLAGQVVQAVLALIVLCSLASPVRPPLALVAGGLLLAVGAVVTVCLRRPQSKLLTSMRSDIQHGLVSKSAGPGVVAASVVTVVGHAATFVLAARTAGVSAPLPQLLPQAMLVLLAMALPMNVGGWGPREGVAAWAFGAAGLGANHGVATATVFGVMVFVASLPGAAALAFGWLRRRHVIAQPVQLVELEGAVRG